MESLPVIYPFFQANEGPGIYVWSNDQTSQLHRLTGYQVHSNLALRTFSVRAILVLKVKNVLILTVIYYINHQLVIGDLVLKVKQVLILTVLKAKFDCNGVPTKIGLFQSSPSSSQNHLQLNLALRTIKIRTCLTLRTKSPITNWWFM